METPTIRPAEAAATSPPVWLFAATAILALACLVMAVAETTLWTHYLIDGGEWLSLFGLAFILGAGVFLYRRQRLFVSLPLILPWLVYPIITQGDQAIDNLSINQMRLITHLLLAFLFAMPVGVLVLAARHAFSPGRGWRLASREWVNWMPGLRHFARNRPRAGVAELAAVLFALEIWVAYRYLGTLMIVTLAVMILATLTYGRWQPALRRPNRSEPVAFVMLIVGLATSLALFISLKNRPGAYQGSPSHFSNPAAGRDAYPLDRVPVPAAEPSAPASPQAARDALTAYARSLDRLLAGYYILDRNYNYHFHNELFLRATPLLPGYRAAGLAEIDAGRRLLGDADALAGRIRADLPASDPFAALLDDVRGYVSFQFERARLLEGMSAEFQRTKAGLQHATHLYEGEGKLLGVTLANLRQKHHRVLAAAELTAVTGEFTRVSQSVSSAYANRIVGF